MYYSLRVHIGKSPGVKLSEFSPHLLRPLPHLSSLPLQPVGHTKITHHTHPHTRLSNLRILFFFHCNEKGRKSISNMWKGRHSAHLISHVPGCKPLFFTWDKIKSMLLTYSWGILCPHTQRHSRDQARYFQQEPTSAYLAKLLISPGHFCACVSN